MRYLMRIALLFVIGFSCTHSAQDEDARAMSGAFTALLEKYDLLADSVSSDSAYWALQDNRKMDLQMLLSQYDDKDASPSIEIVRSQILIELKEYEKAIARLNEIIEKESDFSDLARFGKVRALQALDEMSKALTLFETIQHTPDINDQYLRVLMNFAYGAPKLSDQEKYTRQLLTMDTWPENDLKYKSYMYRNLALIEFKKGNTTEAKSILDEGMTVLKESGQTEVLESTLTLINLVGTEAPALFAETWINSGPLRLKKLHGKVVVIDFWATWCAPCRAVIPSLVETYEKYKKNGLVVIGYTRLYGRYRDDMQRLGAVEPKDEIRLTGEFLKRFKMSYPVAIAHDKKGFEDYAIRGIPTLIFVDKKGKIVDFKIGSGDEKYVSDRIQELLDIRQPS